MKITRLKSLLMAGAFFCFGLLQAQEVTGTVSDSNGPLPGASVVVKGTANGTQTDFDGNYTISVDGEGTLVFSYVGFSTKEVAIDGQSTINVTLDEDAEALDEVIIVGYGSTTKKDATGAIDAVNADDLSTISAVNPAQALRGKVAGVQISQTNGETGGGISIRVRGNTSVRSGNDPLIVVDGIPLSGGDVSAGGANIAGIGKSAPKSALNFINQEDIESITVLKDASSTAIYGSRGANGVIIITTKGGKSGDAKFNFSTNVSIGSLRGDIEVMNGSQYAERVGALGLSEDFGGRSYDWKDAILQTSISTSYNLSATFGNENSRNRLSLGVQDTEGIIKNTGLQRYSINFDNKTSAFDNVVTLNTKLSVTQIEDEAENTSDDPGFIGNLISSAYTWNPTRETRNADGSYNVVSDTYLNPVQLLDAYDDQTSTTRILASISPKIKITDALSFNMVLGIDYSTSQRTNQILPSFRLQNFDHTVRLSPDGNPVAGFATLNTLERFNKTVENYFTYNTDVSDNFSLKALLGYSYYDYNSEGNFVSARDFSLSQYNLVDNMEGGVSTETRTSSYRSRNELQSYYGRLETTIYDKLLVNASLRIDGSTRFGADNRYGTFPAIGAAYNFFDNAEGSLNALKLRLNWGITGNQEFNNNSALFVGQYENAVLNPTTNVNNALKWETTTSYGAGVDYALLDYKVSGSVDFFFKETEDLIFPTDPAGGVPGASITRFVNLPGVLENTGFEFSVNYDAVETEDIDFSIGANMSYITNKMKNFSRTEFTGDLNGQGLSGALSQVITDGEPIFTYFTKDWAGFDGNGLSTFRRADGSITDLSDAPELLLSGKTGLPKLNIGFNTNFRYKSFDFTTSWYGQYGHYIYNNTANAYFYTSAFNGGRNLPASYASGGQSESDVATPSSLYIEKGDFLKLGNLGLGYTINVSKFKYLDNLRVFFNATNLLVITDYSGFDPEVSVNSRNKNGVPGAGIDYLGYPNNKSFTFGVNVKF